MAKITLETRRAAYDEILESLGARYRQVLDELSYGPASARELAMRLWQKGSIPSPERNFVHPRLTELEQVELVSVIDKKPCPISGKTVAIYERVTKETHLKAMQGELALEPKEADHG
ncbi:hypothetical protein SAMN05444487_11848 [Marininema mesophilum]|uniref:Uncharacterized protein n=1 Tax=Marininema mesophilum TaxID=1048340 RepID=A0A1H3BVI4_9BACL|nr:hypothetical protein [Marininema mesophilum]SDX45846.1 hypothetical protein SAMN05444487_11848 [Marininema mesophilum]